MTHNDSMPNVRDWCDGCVFPSSSSDGNKRTVLFPVPVFASLLVVPTDFSKADGVAAAIVVAVAVVVVVALAVMLVSSLRF
jgi:hypothetical protein